MNRARRRRFTSKLRAKYFLKNNLIKCMGAALIVYGLGMVGSAAASVVLPDQNTLLSATDPTILICFAKYIGLSVLVDLILSPLQIAFYWWLSELSMLRTRKITDASFWFSDIKHFFGAIGAKCVYYLAVLRDALLFFGVPAGAMFLAGKYLPEASMGVMMSVTYVGSLVMLAGSVITLMDVLSYRPALYLYAASPERGIKTVFSECRSFMARRKGEFFLLNLSMIGWFLLEILTSGIMMIYTRPFYDLTILIYTQYAYKLWLVDSGKLSRDKFEFPLPGLPEFDSGWLW